jgi:2-keto-3-deoxy-L-arabinonate dehydratase
MKRGVHAILYAFFDEHEQLDRASMRRQTELCLEAGVAGIAALGLATEVAKLSFEERCTLMDWVSQDTGSRAPLGFTIFGQSVAEQIALVRHAEKCKADWLILQPPQTGSYDADEYISFFSRVMSATALPVAIQNAPQYLRRSLSVDDIQRLRDRHANFTLIKSEASAADAAILVKIAGPEFKVFNGRGGADLLECLDAGCEGFLLAPDIADLSAEVMRLHESGDKAAAREAYVALQPTVAFVMQSIEHLVCYGKRLFALRAGFHVFDRAPALRPDSANIELLAQIAARLGSFGRRMDKSGKSVSIGASHIPADCSPNPQTLKRSRFFPVC